jgi:hypothetical protein
MKNYTLLSLLILGLFLASCDDDDPVEIKTGQLEVEFAVEYEGEPVVYFDPYYYEDSLLMGFSRVNFYFSDFKLNDQMVEEIAFIDFESVSAPGSATSALTHTIDDVEVGSYSDMSFSIGVPQRMNDKVPADFDSDHPLSKVSEYWEGWTSYIFAKFEGNLDLSGDGMRETGFSFHMGGNEVFRTLNASGLPLEIQEDETTNIKIIIELKELFKTGDDEFIDLTDTQGSHNANELDFMEQWSDNYGDAFRIEL